ncbi:MAG TPA: DUF692 domain-containing protein [Myxococcota bacterium]|nr:DUF692 domain-containing protein [Myxococcota bacterium]
MPVLGIGVGYRVPHYQQVVDERPEMDWFEILSENHMTEGGSPRWYLEQLAERYPVVPHGVSLSLGGAADPEHLRRLRGLVDFLRPPWFSDHLCWTGTREHRVHDLLPLPYTPAIRDGVVERVRRVQGEVGSLLAVENVSAYLNYKDSTVAEWDFLGEVAEAADCAILLDVNNIFVSSCNLGFDPMVYLDGLPLDRVVQVHLAGHSVFPKYRLDTHDHPVCDEVWAIYRELVRRIGPVSTLIEWDGNIPSFERLQAEVATAKEHRDRALLERG